MKQTNKKAAALVMSFSLLFLAGCGADTTVTDSTEKLFTVGNTTYTKGQEYQLVKRINGPNLTLQAAQQLIYNEEVGDGEEIQKEAQEMYDQYAGYTEDFDEQIKTYGYADKQDYIDSVLIPSVQAQKLLEKYFTDGKDAIEADFKPTLAAVIECDSQDNADKARKAIEDGQTPAEAGKQYAKEGATYTGAEQIISTLDTSLPVRIVNSLYETENTGLLDETFTNDTSTDDITYYVVDLISNDYDANLDKIIEALGSNTDINTDCNIYYLKKYDFEVHDQYIFDYFKNNNPEYLVTRPDLSETK